MLILTIPESTRIDTNNEVIHTEEMVLKLEHSLVSISIWESHWHKPFLGNEDISGEELLDYIKCMTLNEDIPDEFYKNLPVKIVDIINDYMKDPMTATTINSRDKKGIGVRKEVITSEIIYYWMLSLQIPVEFQHWHINRLLTLIEVCNIKNNPKKMSKAETMNEHKSLNKARREAAKKKKQ